MGSARVARLILAGCLLGLFGGGSVSAAPGDPNGSPFQVNTYTTGGQHQAAVGPDGSGGFVVVWRSELDAGFTQGTIRGQRYDSTGAAVGSEFQVNTYTTGIQRNAAVGPDGSGGFIALWQSRGSGGTDTDNDSVQGQRYDSSGAPVGGQFQVNSYTTGGQRAPEVAPDGAGGFVVVWESIGGCTAADTVGCVQARRHDSSGAPVGAEFQVNTYTTDLQYYPAVGTDGGGGFVVVWTSIGSAGTDTDGRSVQGQRFDSLGGPVGSEFEVNTYTSGRQNEPRVAPDGTGGFVVVWRSAGSSGTDGDYSIQGQRYDGSGAAVGSEFQVNTYTPDLQSNPDVEADGSGGFVVVWYSFGLIGSDTLGTSIQGRRYDSSGAPVGVQFQVNAYTTGNQVGSRVAPDGAGGFVVVWSSDGCSGTDADACVEGQRFLGSNTTTTSTTSTTATSTTSTTTTSTSSSTTTTLSTNLLTGKKIVIKDSQGNPARRRLVVISKDTTLDVGAPDQAPNGSANDPTGTVSPLRVQVFGLTTGDADTQNLATGPNFPDGGWKLIGLDGDNKGYRYRDKALSSSACKVGVLKSSRAPGSRPGRLKLVCKGAGLGYSLDEASQDDVGVIFQLGTTRYCMVFGPSTGATVLKDEPDKFIAKDAGAPASCPP